MVDHLFSDHLRSIFHFTNAIFNDGRLANMLEGAGLLFDIQKCLKFQKSIMVVLEL